MISDLDIYRAAIGNVHIRGNGPVSVRCGCVVHYTHATKGGQQIGVGAGPREPGSAIFRSAPRTAYPA